MPVKWGGGKVEDYIGQVLLGHQKGKVRKNVILKWANVLLRYPRQNFCPLSWTNGNHFDRPHIIHESSRVESKIQSLICSSPVGSSQSPTDITKEEIDVLSVIDWDEYYVHNLVAHEE